MVHMACDRVEKNVTLQVICSEHLCTTWCFYKNISHVFHTHDKISLKIISNYFIYISPFHNTIWMRFYIHPSCLIELDYWSLIFLLVRHMAHPCVYVVLLPFFKFVFFIWCHPLIFRESSVHNFYS